jgi:hypothetical protein
MGGVVNYELLPKLQVGGRAVSPDRGRQRHACNIEPGRRRAIRPERDLSPAGLSQAGHSKHNRDRSHVLVRRGSLHILMIPKGVHGPCDKSMSLGPVRATGLRCRSRACSVPTPATLSPGICTWDTPAAWAARRDPCNHPAAGASRQLRPSGLLLAGHHRRQDCGHQPRRFRRIGPCDQETLADGCSGCAPRPGAATESAFETPATADTQASGRGTTTTLRSPEASEAAPGESRSGNIEAM